MSEGPGQGGNAQSEDDGNRRARVLREALFLVAEKGIAGASLRKLAARLGMSQPSLYHYFKSKDALIDELVQMGARHMLEVVRLDELPRVPLEKLAHKVKENIFRLWEGDEHAYYTRFLFVVAIENPKHQAVIRRVFEQQLRVAPSDEIVRLFRGDSAFAKHLFECLTMQARAMGLCLIEERLLFGEDRPSERTRAHADFIADVVSNALLQFDAGRKK